MVSVAPPQAARSRTTSLATQAPFDLGRCAPLRSGRTGSPFTVSPSIHERRARCYGLNVPSGSLAGNSTFVRIVSPVVRPFAKLSSRMGTSTPSIFRKSE